MINKHIQKTLSYSAKTRKIEKKLKINTTSK